MIRPTYLSDSVKLDYTKQGSLLCTFHRAGGKAGSVRTCTGCKGRGIKVSIRQIGPGMVQQMQSSCNECGGEGKTNDINVAVCLVRVNNISQGVHDDDKSWYYSCLITFVDDISMLPSF